MLKKLRVVKLGGSLLDLPLLSDSLTHFLDDDFDGVSVWVVGGGATVDDLRTRWSAGELSDMEAHRMAVEAMNQNNRVLTDPPFNWSQVDSINQLKDQTGAGAGSENIVFDSNTFVAQHSALPCSWDVTSDSIAAILACEIDATSVVLLKSEAPKSSSLIGLIEDGYVDRYFETAFTIERVEFVNLRSSPLTRHVVIRSKPS